MASGWERLNPRISEKLDRDVGRTLYGADVVLIVRPNLYRVFTRSAKCRSRDLPRKAASADLIGRTPCRGSASASVRHLATANLCIVNADCPCPVTSAIYTAGAYGRSVEAHFQVNRIAEIELFSVGRRVYVHIDDTLTEQPNTKTGTTSTAKPRNTVLIIFLPPSSRMWVT